MHDEPSALMHDGADGTENPAVSTDGFSGLIDDSSDERRI